MFNRYNMNKKISTFVVVIFVLTLFSFLPFSKAQAETSKYRLFSYVTKREVVPIVFFKAPANIVFERRGMANFENGEVATYLARGTAKATPAGGTAEGYSQLTFNDGSTSVVKWEVKFSKSEKTKLNTYTGTGKYVQGTGRFEGIQGDITIVGEAVTPYTEETQNDAFFDITSNYTLPSK